MADELEQASRRTPNTARGKAMRQLLLKSGQESFLTLGYHGTSVAGICKLAGVSNAAYYQYFADKESLFLILWEEFQTLLLADLARAAAQGRGLKGRVEMAATALTDRLSQERGLFQVYREAEFVAASLSRSFWHQLEQQLPALLGVEGVEPPALVCFMLGAIYFNLVSRSVWGLEHHPLPTILNLLLHGMAPPSADPVLWRQAWGSEPGQGTPTPLSSASATTGRALSKGKLTRQRLLEAAEQRFGDLGYHQCSTSQVCMAAGVAQGTFFRYFPTKRAILEELVRRTNRRLKAVVAQAIAGAGHQLRAEARSTRAFLSFIEHHREMYRVVREAEFSERELGRWYYLDLAESYRVLLEPAMNAGELCSLDPLALALAIMGVGHHLGLRWPVWEQCPVPERALGDTLDLMMLGMLGVAATRAPETPHPG